MHEMAITQSVVDAVCEHAAGRRVHSVKLEVGELCAVVPDSMLFCFELAAQGDRPNQSRRRLGSEAQPSERQESGRGQQDQHQPSDGPSALPDLRRSRHLGARQVRSRHAR